MDLTEILKDHTGEMFYSTIHGEVRLVKISESAPYPIKYVTMIRPTFIWFSKDGKICDDVGECILFPSKDNRDWNDWIENNKKKEPKTWIEYCTEYNIKSESKYISEHCLMIDHITASCQALFKILILVDKGYGGYVTDEEWRGNTPKYVLGVDYSNNSVFFFTTYCKDILAFHTKEQVEEFLSYPENVQLVKDFYQMRQL